MASNHFIKKLMYKMFMPILENPDVEIFEEGIIDSFQTVGLLLEIQTKLDIEVSIMDFDRDEWATPTENW